MTAYEIKHVLLNFGCLITTDHQIDSTTETTLIHLIHPQLNYVMFEIDENAFYIYRDPPGSHVEILFRVHPLEWVNIHDLHNYLVDNFFLNFNKRKPYIFEQLDML